MQGQGSLRPTFADLTGSRRDGRAQDLASRHSKRSTGEGGCGKSLILQLRHLPKNVSLWMHLWSQRSPHWQEPP